jgi:hypothetical protein
MVLPQPSMTIVNCKYVPLKLLPATSSEPSPLLQERNANQSMRPRKKHLEFETLHHVASAQALTQRIDAAIDRM